MAFAIVVFRGLQGDQAFTGLPNQLAANLATGGPSQFMGSQADLAVGASTNSTIFNAGVPLATYKALVWMKVSTLTGNLEVRLQCSSSATFASDIVDLDTKVEIVAVTGVLKSFVLYGCVSDTLRQFSRVNFTTTAGAATVDLVVTGI